MPNKQIPSFSNVFLASAAITAMALYSLGYINSNEGFISLVAAMVIALIAMAIALIFSYYKNNA